MGQKMHSNYYNILYTNESERNNFFKFGKMLIEHLKSRGQYYKAAQFQKRLQSIEADFRIFD